MPVPFKKRFKFNFEIKGFYFHLMLGFIVVYVSHKWAYIPEIGDPKISEIAIGWIPWNIQEGEVIPAWKPYHREYREMQR